MIIIFTEDRYLLHTKALAISLFIGFLFVAGSVGAQTGILKQETRNQHPCLILMKRDIPAIKAGVETYPFLKQSLNASRAIADRAIQSGILVPVPKDPAGGFTHIQHTYNYETIYRAGQVYQLTGEKKYAIFVRDMLLAYAKMYPSLGLHPENKGSGPGKLFWQGLNDSVWLVYAIQAFDCIFDFVSENDRKEIETNLFGKIVNFFTVDDSYTFNRVHNHGTWSVAGVGMAGLVMNKPEWVREALYSTKLDGSGGFLKQINDLFSPDGYYAEGPYYQRYALLPFVVFAQALENNRPELKIFECKDGVILKAMSMLMQLTNTDGRFYPLNDAMKEKSWVTPEMVFASNIVFARTHEKQLLDVAQKNGNVMLSSQGLDVARSIANNETETLVRKSMSVRDGADGKQGGLALLRTGKENDQASLILKYASQGMGHGHFDRLSFCLYDAGHEIVSDYGSARFLNVEAKDCGRYLDENTTWAKQSVAHNTMVVNGKSQYHGNVGEAEKFHPYLLFSDLKDESFQIVSAVDSNCYKGSVMQRTMALVNNKYGRFIIDLFRIENREGESVCDLPVYYQGQIMSTTFHFEKSLTEMKVLGKENGYQHLWIEASASNLKGMASATWMTDKRFYTLSFLADQNTEFLFTRIGANDPRFNLRAEPGLMLRQKAVKEHAFLSVLEMHGNYNPGSELVTRSNGSLKGMELMYSDEKTTGIKLQFTDETSMVLLIANRPDDKSIHQVKFLGTEYKWIGNYKIITN